MSGLSDPKLGIGTRFCLCRSCGQYFGGASGFDLHRRDGRCVPPDSLVDGKGTRLLFLNTRGYWGKRLPENAFLEDES